VDLDFVAGNDLGSSGGEILGSKTGVVANNQPTLSEVGLF